jgi:hypothetical protein
MALALEQIIRTETRPPQSPRPQEHEGRLNIAVIFTSVEATLGALRKAGGLASSQGARIMLLALQAVPFPLPLDSPPVLLDWNQRRFRVIATESPVDTIVRLYLCRDRTETLLEVLGPHSVVVIGGQRSLWAFAAEKRLARRLRRAGHDVIFAETE